MGEAKNRKNEIENIKNGNVLAVNGRYDDYDNAGLIILKAATVKHKTLSKDIYSYKIMTWAGKDIPNGFGNDEMIKMVADTPILGEKNTVIRVKNAIITLLEGFNKMYVMGQMDVGNRIDRVKNQEELEHAWASYFAPFYQGHTCDEKYIVA